MNIKIDNKPFNITLNQISADKSISHRAAIFSLLTDGMCTIKNYLLAQDCIYTLKAIELLGAKVNISNNNIEIQPPKNIVSPNDVINCGNSGTLIRILIGLLSSTNGDFVLNGDKYLNNRPMKRVSEFLNSQGAQIYGRELANYAPLYIKGVQNQINYFEFENHIKSAQVKTALILSALQSKGCKIIEPEISRDHTENLLKYIGAPINCHGNTIEVKSIKTPLKSYNIEVPNDPSSAFFFAVLCAISKNSKLTLKNMLINKTRIGAYEVLKKMGCKINYVIKHSTYEDIGDIEIESSELHSIEVDSNISWLIDEIPALSIAFLYANGTSKVRNAKELRVKECDRIKAVLSNFEKLGVEYNEYEDGFEIVGKSAKTNKAIFDSFGDHRIAMSFALLGKDFDIYINDAKCVDVSFANFYEILGQFGAKYDS